MAVFNNATKLKYLIFREDLFSKVAKKKSHTIIYGMQYSKSCNTTNAAESERASELDKMRKRKKERKK